MLLVFFFTDQSRLESTKDKYRRGAISDMECKSRLADETITLTGPVRQRRSEYEKDMCLIPDVFKKSTKQANEVAEVTLAPAKKQTNQDFFDKNILSLS